MIALAMICKGEVSEAKHLDKCLRYVSGEVDKVYITITGGNNKKEVEKVCKKYNAEISYFEWIKDFAAARNFNFKQVPKNIAIYYG